MSWGALEREKRADDAPAKSASTWARRLGDVAGGAAAAAAAADDSAAERRARCAAGAASGRRAPAVSRAAQRSRGAATGAEAAAGGAHRAEDATRRRDAAAADATRQQRRPAEAAHAGEAHVSRGAASLSARGNAPVQRCIAAARQGPGRRGRSLCADRMSASAKRKARGMRRWLDERAYRGRLNVSLSTVRMTCAVCVAVCVMRLQPREATRCVSGAPRKARLRRRLVQREALREHEGGLGGVHARVARAPFSLHVHLSHWRLAALAHALALLDRHARRRSLLEGGQQLGGACGTNEDAVLEPASGILATRARSEACSAPAPQPPRREPDAARGLHRRRTVFLAVLAGAHGDGSSRRCRAVSAGATGSQRGGLFSEGLPATQSQRASTQPKR